MANAAAMIDTCHARGGEDCGIINNTFIPQEEFVYPSRCSDLDSPPSTEIIETPMVD